MPTANGLPRGGAQLEPAQAHELSGLVNLVSGSVVSRTLQKGPAGTVTLFAMARDQELSEHTAPFDAHVLGLEGDLALTVGNRQVTLSRGQIVLMPAKVPHALKAMSDARFLLIMIRQ
jgi:quercetin dioxygenase-like cupin family protein